MYEKRLCILKQLKNGFSADGAPLTGAIYLEQFGGEVVVTPKIVGLSPLREGRYALALKISGQSFCFELRGGEPLRIPQAPSIGKGFSALLCFVRGKAEPVAFGSCGAATDRPETLLEIFSHRSSPAEPNPEENYPKTEKSHAFHEKETEDRQPGGSSESEKNLFSAEERPEGIKESESEAPKYDDEAIASTDYFSAECDRKNKDDVQEEDLKDEMPDGNQEEIRHPFANPRGTLAYYREIAPRLASAMQKFPKDESLTKTFPQSQWVKTENGLLGVIFSRGQPQYLCVAMKTEPPEEVREASVFVPVSPFDDTDGYYVVFQDADTGDYVKVENA